MVDFIFDAFCFLHKWPILSDR